MSDAVPTLPAALRAWREPLAIFPRELALSLGPMLQRLAVLVGPFPALRQGEEGDPNGLDGITRRGRLERLLLSQWALAQEAPDEFVRRAAQQELQFFALARQRPQGRRRCVVLLDAGPMQMGSPRILGVAAVVLLAARAQAAGAAFGFGVLQRPKEGLWTQVTPATVRQYLLMRGASAPDEAHLLAWEAALGKPATLDDLWLLGDARVPHGWSFRPSRLLAQDVLEPDARALDVTVVRGSVQRTARVELPAEDAAVRLVRDPFAAAVAPPRVVGADHAPRSNPVFSHHGQWVFTRGRAGQVVAWPVPNSPRAAPGHPRIFKLPYPNTGVVAVGMRGRSVVVLGASEDALTLTTFNKRGGVESAVQHRAPGSPLTDLFVDARPLRALMPGPGNTREMFLLDPTQNVLWRLNPEGLVLQQEAAHVTAAAGTDQREVLFARTSANGMELCALGPQGLKVRSEAEVTPLAFLGPARSLRGVGGAMWGLHRTVNTCVVFPSTGPQVLSAPEGSRVLGVAELHREGVHAVLLALEADHRTVVALGRSSSLVLTRLPAQLWTHGVCTGAHVMACITTAGHVVLLSTLTGQLLFQAQAQRGDVLEAA